MITILYLFVSFTGPLIPLYSFSLLTHIFHYKLSNLTRVLLFKVLKKVPISMTSKIIFRLMNVSIGIMYLSNKLKRTF